MFQNRRFSLSLGILSVLTVACGGGGSSPSSPHTPSPSPSPTATSTTPASTSASGTIGGPSPSQLAAGASGGYAISLLFPGDDIPASTSVTVSNGPAAPAGLTAPSFADRGVAAVHPLAAPPSGILDYVTLTFGSSFALTALPGLTFTLSATADPNQQYFLALYSVASGWTDAVAGPAVVSGSTITFSALELSSALPIQSNTPYIVALYATSGVSPTPGPTQSPLVTAASFSNVPLTAFSGSTVAFGSPGSAFAGSIAFPAMVANSNCLSTIPPTVSGSVGTSAPTGSPLFANQGGTDFYIALTFSCSLTIGGTSSLTINVPSGSVDVDYAIGATGTYSSAIGLTAVPTGSTSGGYTTVTISPPATFNATVPGNDLITVVLFPVSGP